MGSGSAKLVGQGDLTRVTVMLDGVAYDPTDPRLVAEVFSGPCRALPSSPRALERATGAAGVYPLVPYVDSERIFGVTLPIALAKLRGGAHTMTIGRGPGRENGVLACADIG